VAGKVTGGPLPAAQLFPVVAVQPATHVDHARDTLAVQGQDISPPG
jgi:hypothetical protein